MHKGHYRGVKKAYLINVESPGIPDHLKLNYNKLLVCTLFIMPRLSVNHKYLIDTLHNTQGQFTASLPHRRRVPNPPHSLKQYYHTSFRTLTLIIEDLSELLMTCEFGNNSSISNSNVPVNMTDKNTQNISLEQLMKYQNQNLEITIDTEAENDSVE